MSPVDHRVEDVVEIAVSDVDLDATDHPTATHPCHTWPPCVSYRVCTP